MNVIIAGAGSVGRYMAGQLQDSGHNVTLIDNNNTKNDLLVADGQTVVIGGLTQTSVRVTKSGLPLLVDLPLIGRLFGYTTRQEQRRDLLVLITPHIIDEGQQSPEARR